MFQYVRTNLIRLGLMNTPSVCFNLYDYLCFRILCCLFLIVVSYGNTPEVVVAVFLVLHHPLNLPLVLSCSLDVPKARMLKLLFSLMTRP